MLLNESGGDSCSCAAVAPGVVGAVIRGRTLFEAVATALPDHDADLGGKELIEVPLELARRRRGHPCKLLP